MLLTTAAMCLALNIYHEARSESLTGQHAVAQVTFNRAGRDPNRICEEVFKPKQFSWANPLTSVKGKERQRRAQKFIPREDKAWMIAKQIAKLTVDGYIKDFTKGAMFYHTTAVRPVWRKDFKLTTIIGRHKFYTFA
jgi:spore germination cell wall hydrolase CwlJ-like protein